MPFKDKAQKAAWQLEYMRRRRASRTASSQEPWAPTITSGLTKLADVGSYKTGLTVSIRPRGRPKMGFEQPRPVGLVDADGNLLPED